MSYIAFGRYVMNKHAFKLNDSVITKKDYEAACNYAIAKAQKTYDPNKAKFTTYAYYKLRREITDVNRHITKHNEAVQLDDYFLETYTGYARKDEFETICESMDIQNAFEVALNEFNEEHRDIILDRYINNMTYKQMSEQRNVSESTMRNRCRKVLPRFKKIFRNEL